MPFSRWHRARAQTAAVRRRVATGRQGRALEPRIRAPFPAPALRGAAAWPVVDDGLAPHRPDEEQRDPRYGERLALSENPFGCSPAALAAMRAELDGVCRYPDASSTDLRDRLAGHHGFHPDQVIVGNGADEILLMPAPAFAGPEAPSICSASTYLGHAAALRVARSDVRTSRAGRDGVDVAGFAAAMRGASIAFLCNPHNPSGRALNPEAIAELAAAARETECLLVVDEAYAEFASEAGWGSALPHVGDGHVVVVRTFSKAYGLAGARCGYAIGDSRLIGQMSVARHAVPFSPNRIALAGAAAALEDHRHLHDVVTRTRTMRRRLREQLAGLGFPTSVSETNFLLVDVGGDSKSAAARLRDHHALRTRPCDAFGLPGFVRLGVCNEDRLDAVLAGFGDLASAGDRTA